MEQVSQHFLLSITPLKHGYHYTGTLKIPDSSVPAKMTVKFPLSKYLFLYSGLYNFAKLMKLNSLYLVF